MVKKPENLTTESQRAQSGTEETGGDVVRILTSTEEIVRLARLVIVILAFASPLFAADRAEILGRWRGTSICTKVEGNQYCHDEQVQYDFTAAGADAVHVDAQKLVDGSYQSMFGMDFRYDASTKRWTSKFHTRRDDRDGIWSFEIHGDRMTGTCVLLPDTLVRNASATRVK